MERQAKPIEFTLVLESVTYLMGMIGFVLKLPNFKS